MTKSTNSIKVNVFTGGLDLRSAKGESLEKFAKGLFKSGVNVELIQRCKYLPCDIAVIFGEVKNHGKRQARMSFKAEIIGRHIRKGLIFVDTPIITRSYSGGSLFRRVGIDGILRDTGDFFNSHMTSKRWDDISSHFGIKLLPWKQDGEIVLFALQRPYDASLKGSEQRRPERYKRWIIKTCQEISSRIDKPIVLRPHPESIKNAIEREWLQDLQSHTFQIEGVCWDRERTIRESLAEAYACVTYNSGSGVDAAIAGVPVFCADPGSFAWEVSSNDVRKVASPIYPNRNQWLNNLAYVEWSLNEIEMGLPWLHLRPRLLEVI